MESAMSRSTGYEDCFVADSFSFGVEREMSGDTFSVPAADTSTDDLAVDPNNPNVDLRDGEYVLTGLQHGATEGTQIGQPITFTVTIGNIGTSSATGDSYAGSHSLYQDLFVP
jgi:hypothetical protein